MTPDEARTALVTGGGRGIGRAVVARLAAEDYDVVATGRDRGTLEEAAAEADAASGRRGAVTVRECDVTDEAEVADLAAEAGPVAVLVNNAGVAGSAPLGRTSLDQWRACLDVNATGAFLMTRAVIDGMRERGQGRIVIVASTAGLAGARYTAAYTASKHAAVGLMRVAAAELAGTGATANAVCPSFVRSEMTDRTITTITEATGRSREEALDALLEASPLGRLLEPEEVADAVAYLCGPRASAVNGQTIVMDGGELQT
ncbi:SDR family oxidoreductase [Egibacter rhizosphaerae]|uniref:SDR family oxidoreductase n=1 Tax=Egibacter rhizosphaerae TaxID=1670831 RepID=A0A411YFF3_9ACTN|nr:SDR family NAD(P)-dependent oxidoreductase [Egibacter rhizosphaerae]QBI19837.1 SDR family oxidoreductase [Egibacter rhizosphaerae]